MLLPDARTITAEQCSADIYLALAPVTAAPIRCGHMNEALLHELTHYIIGFAGETGELFAALDKERCAVHDDDHAKAVQNQLEEIGDHLWYLANIVNLLEDEFPDLRRSWNSLWTRKHVRVEITSADYGMLSTIGGTLLDVVKRQWYYKPQAISEFPSDSQVVSLVQAVENALHLLGRILQTKYDTDLSAVAAANLRKLAVRFGEKFDDIRAFQRNTQTEMEAHG